MAVAEQLRESDDRRPAWWTAVGAHIGLLLVAFSAAWTIQPEGWFNRGQWAAFALIGLATLIAGVVGLSGRAAGLAVRALLALGAATALHMAYDPQLISLPGFAGLGAGPVGMLEPGLAHLGVVVVALFAAIQAGTGGRGRLARTPFAGAVIAAAALLLALGGVMWLGLHNLYDLSAASGMAMLAFRTLSFALLLLGCLVMSDVRGFGGVAQAYVGVALLAAIARNLGGMN